MTFNKYNVENLAHCDLGASLGASAQSIVAETGKGGLFPASDFWIRIYAVDSENRVIKQEIVFVPTRTGDIFQNCIRGADNCPADWQATTQTNIQFAFFIETEEVYIDQVFPKAQIEDIQDEIERLEQDKADDNVVVKLSGNQTIDDVKTFTSSPQVPTGVNPNDAVNKAQLDTEILAAGAVEALHDRDTYMLGEDVLENDSLFREDMIRFGEVPTTDAIGTTLNSTSTITTKNGVRIQAQLDCLLTDVEISSAIVSGLTIGATVAYLYDSSFVLLQTVPLPSFVATFNYILKQGQTYHILVDADGGSHHRQSRGSLSFPLAGTTNINYTGGVIDNTSISNNTLYNIISIKTLTLTQVEPIGNTSANTRKSIVMYGSGVAGDTINIGLRKYISPSADFELRVETDNAGEPSGTLFDPDSSGTVAESAVTTNVVDTAVTLAGTITIPLGQKVHLVARQVGDATNASNYYGIAYASKNTTTRPLNTFDGSVWGTADEDKFMYVSSDLFLPQLLSKTDATYSYKLPVDFPRFANEAKSAGEECITTYYGLKGNFAGLSIGTPYYVGVGGLLSLNAGANPYILGYAIAPDIINVGGLNPTLPKEQITLTYTGTSISDLRSNSLLLSKDTIIDLRYSVNNLSSLGSRSVGFQTSSDGYTWTTIDSVSGNASTVQGIYCRTVFVPKGYYIRAVINVNSANHTTSTIDIRY